MEWQTFKYREIRAAKTFAEEGGIAIHVCYVLPEDAKAPRCFKGKLFGHMMGPDEEQLTAAAKKLGCRPQWVQKPPKVSYLHYDLTASRLKNALKRCSNAQEFLDPESCPEK